MKISRLYIAAAICASLLAAVSCKDDAIRPEKIPAVNVTSEKLSPDTDESGKVRAYVGTAVTAKGINLDKVTKVTFGDLEAPILSASLMELVFEIPELGLAQDDEPQQVILRVWGESADKPVFTWEYYVTIPVTETRYDSFTPASGTVGTALSFSGRNLDRVSAVKFGDVAVNSFTAQSATTLELAVPAMPATEANTKYPVSIVWEEGTIETEDSLTFLRPVFEAFSQGGEAALGDEFILAGENLELVDSLVWGSEKLLIVSATATEINVKIPTGLDTEDPAIARKALDAYYGNPGTGIRICEEFAINTTPAGPAAPVFSSAAVESGYSNIYLGKEVTVSGENMSSVEGFKIDGISVPLNGEVTDIAAKFTVPSGITGNAAKEVDLSIIWGGGNELSCGKITVYPFYYTKGLQICPGSNSASTYPAENRDAAFLIFEEGKVISVDEFKSRNIDSFVFGDTPIVTTKNIVSGTQEQYYSVKPYTLLTADSSNKLAFQCPSNSNGQLKTHSDSEGNKLPSVFGSAVVYFSVVTADSLKSKVLDASLADITYAAPKAGAAAPAFATAESSSTWAAGSVICVEYVDYTTAAAGAKPGDNLAGVRNIGYIVTHDVTCGDAETGKAKADRKGYVSFDLYWSNVL